MNVKTLGQMAIWISAWAAVVLPAAAAWADPAPQPLIKRLDGPTRAKVLAALAGLVILGFGMVALAWLGARMTQRYRNSKPYHRPTPRPGEHDWAKKPLDESGD
ncbi:MAG: hypothetical protein L0211_19100 [Planctomycetaceae bacterium]|nr:hypothetical protein [Planctomycetaceae bacterium]